MLLRIILILIIPVLSIVCSLMSSGVENILTANNKEWQTIPIFYWLIFWSIFWFALYRTKFRSTKRLKIFILRAIIKVRIKYVNMNIIDTSDQLNQMQKKAIQTWSNLLKDKDSIFSCCLLTNRRMLIKGDITCIISTGNEANFNYVKLGKNAVYFDVWLPNSIIAEMFNSFDKEHKMRFQKSVDSARLAISQLN